MNQPAQLIVNRLKFAVHLGWTAHERVNPQFVEVTIKFLFANGTQASKTDDLKDTICYHTLSDALRDMCAEKEYKLIEHLSQRLLEKTREVITFDVQVNLALTKVSPPLAELQGGATFICGDFF